MWVFLTKTKKPPLTIFGQFLKEHGHPTAKNRTVRSDQGGELWGSQAFRETVHQAGYIMDPTAPKAAFQNAKAERPNRNFGKTVQCLLYNANLGPEYWSFALLHAVYLKNRLRHCTTNQVLLTAYTGKRPNAKRLRLFGCPVIVCHQTRTAKLDLNTSAGIFLGYTATDQNILYRDSITGRFKTATHLVFDEAGMTLPATERSPAAKVLQELGYGMHSDDDADDVPIEENDMHVPGDNHDVPLPSTILKSASSISVVNAISHDDGLQVKCLSLHATLPVRATDGSAGYDLFSAVDTLLQPHTRCAIPLDISITLPRGTYAQILSRSGLCLKHHIDVRAGTIDRDYTGNVQVILENMGNEPSHINIGDRIAQMVLINIQTPVIHETQQLQSTERGALGFGSTGIAGELSEVPSSVNRPVATPADSTNPAIVRNLTTETPPPVVPLADAVLQKPYDIYFSTDPFDSTLEVNVPIKGDHPTLGILTDYCDSRQRLHVRDMALSTPGSRLKSWCTVIRKSYIFFNLMTSLYNLRKIWNMLSARRD